MGQAFTRNKIMSTRIQDKKDCQKALYLIEEYMLKTMNKSPNSLVDIKWILDYTNINLKNTIITYYNFNVYLPHCMRVADIKYHGLLYSITIMKNNNFFDSGLKLLHSSIYFLSNANTYKTLFFKNKIENSYTISDWDDVPANMKESYSKAIYDKTL